MLSSSKTSGRYRTLLLFYASHTTFRKFEVLILLKFEFTPEPDPNEDPSTLRA